MIETRIREAHGIDSDDPRNAIEWRLDYIRNQLSTTEGKITIGAIFAIPTLAPFVGAALAKGERDG